MKSSELNGCTPRTGDAGRPTRLGDETLVDIAVPRDMVAGNDRGFPRVRFLMARPGAESVDRTAEVLPTALKVVEIVFLVNSDTGELEKVALAGVKDKFEVLRTDFGVRCQYEDGTLGSDVRYPVVKPPLRP